ncbi:hypothetical protein LV564_01305 [Komagataeibacter nataicola]|uniref:hypothetical protein n=1 Tax=Komagataeibacter nataicola TaxID=265960 RepID=UPI0023DD1FC9|nr:hypothetical protein [Komagataeibacter nataicola]WEQ55780.1 hypothetical protein LV564_01305 [Komagataeibacter nataicola]
MADVKPAVYSIKSIASRGIPSTSGMQDFIVEVDISTSVVGNFNLSIIVSAKSYAEAPYQLGTVLRSFVRSLQLGVDDLA